MAENSANNAFTTLSYITPTQVIAFVLDSLLFNVQLLCMAILGGCVTKQEHVSNKTILLVDDDAGVRRMLNLTLSRQGHTVLEADSAESAIQVWEHHSQHIDLLLTDIRMPGKTGLELAKILRQKQPKLPVLLISGYCQELNNNEEKISSSMVFLQKPFTTPVLLETVCKATKSCLE